MAEPTLKVVTEAPASADTKPDAAKAKGKWFSRKRLRTILLVVVPLIVVAIGVFIWLGSGRYISTDNAYVQQDKVQVAAEAGGRVIDVRVHENQMVKAGDLLELDRKAVIDPDAPSPQAVKARSASTGPS